MNPEDLALVEKILEYLRTRREPASLNEIKFAVGALLMRTSVAVSKLVASGDIVASAEPPRGRVYYSIARRS